MNWFLREKSSLIIEYVDKFEPLKSGKRRYFYNEPVLFFRVGARKNG